MRDKPYSNMRISQWIKGKSNIPTAALFLIIILGASFRLFGLEIQSLWHDELESWSQSNNDNLLAVVDHVRFTVQAPGYYSFLYFVQQYVGDSEIILRLPSAVSGIFSIPVIFLLGQRLYSYKEGFIAAILMAVLWCPIYYSQEARAYAMLLLFTLLTTYFWLDIVQSLYNRMTVSYYVLAAYVVTAIITSYLHYYGLLLIALQGLAATLFLLQRGRRAFTYVFAVYTLILLTLSPWVPAMVPQFHGEAGSNIQTPEPAFTFFASYIRFLFNQSSLLSTIILVLYAFLLLHSLYMLWKTKGRPDKSLLFDLLLAFWLIIPFAITYLISTTLRPILQYHYLIISLPAAYLLLSRVITRLPINRKGLTIVAVLMIGLFSADLVFRLDYYSQPRKDQFRQAVEFVVERDHLYENSLIVGYAWSSDHFNYYFEKKGSDRSVDLMAGHKKDIPTIINLIETRQPQYLWYISAHRIPDPDLVDFLNRNLRLIDHETFFRADVWLFENGNNVNWNSLGYSVATCGLDSLFNDNLHRDECTDPSLRQSLHIVNPTDKPYVYTYIWNNHQTETYLLDDSSRQGQEYNIEWIITPEELIWFRGQFQEKLSVIIAPSPNQKIHRLDPNSYLAITVAFSDEPDRTTQHIFERRCWFKFTPDGQIEFFFPPEEWYNPRWPDESGWQMEDIDSVMSAY